MAQRVECKYGVRTPGWLWLWLSRLVLGSGRTTNDEEWDRATIVIATCATRGHRCPANCSVPRTWIEMKGKRLTPGGGSI